MGFLRTVRRLLQKSRGHRARGMAQWKSACLRLESLGSVSVTGKMNIIYIST